MDDYIAKPVQRAELVDKVTQWALGKAPAGGKR